MQKPESLYRDLFHPSQLYIEAHNCLLSNNFNDALIYFAESCKSDPLNSRYWLDYAECLMSTNMTELALEAYITVSKLQNSSIINAIIGYLYEKLERFNEALQAYSISILLDPNKFESYNYKGNLLRKLNKHPEAISTFVLGIRTSGPNEHLYNNLGNCFIDLQMIQEAETCYFEALKLMPSMVAAHCNLSAALRAEGKISEAIQFCQKALNLDPGFSDAYACMGNILKDTSNLQQCIVYYTEALKINPNSPITLLNLANIFKDTGDVQNAISCYSRALNIANWFPEAFCNMVYSKIFICDWENIKPNFERLAAYIKYQVDRSLLPSVQPFHALVYPLAPEDKLIISKTYAQFAKLLVNKYPTFPKHISEGKIKIGYVSSDFGDHPLSHLMQSIFEMHDRTQFQVFGFALSPNDLSCYRDKITRGCDFFIDLSCVSDPYKLAETIYSYKIDILINCNGYTRGSRNEIFALHPGRIQLTYMGFPGSLGADYIEYIVSDKIATLPLHTKYYTENIIWMPHSYFVNDYLQSSTHVFDIPSRSTRNNFLPENKFIFANFNQLYKIDPDTFHIWMSILHKVPNSVLWLLRFPAAGEANILKKTVDEGIDPSRVIFTDLVSKKVHIDRCFLADLCLDTPLYNGHTTTCDVLWSGLPVVTLPLETMASRVAASICCALECPEMVANSPEDYEEKAVRLATGPISPKLDSKLPDHIKNRLGSSELKALRSKIEAKRTTAPLFNTQLWVHNLEKGLKVAIELEHKGFNPKNIIIK
jgi:protein O-GlcNAc transferase